MKNTEINEQEKNLLENIEDKGYGTMRVLVADGQITYFEGEFTRKLGKPKWTRPKRVAGTWHLKDEQADLIGAIRETEGRQTLTIAFTSGLPSQVCSTFQTK